MSDLHIESRYKCCGYCLNHEHQGSTCMPPQCTVTGEVKFNTDGEDCSNFRPNINRINLSGLVTDPFKEKEPYDPFKGGKSNAN